VKEGNRLAGELGLEDGVEEGEGAGGATDGAGKVEAGGEDGRGEEGTGEHAGAGLAEKVEGVPEV